jgi:hypothetical protein
MLRDNLSLFLSTITIRIRLTAAHQLSASEGQLQTRFWSWDIGYSVLGEDSVTNI